MSSSSCGDIFEADELLARIRLEFCDGLPQRLSKMRSALEALGGGHDPEMVELLYRTAHSLKGTAPSFGAHGLVGPATALADAGRAWYQGEPVRSEDLGVALANLERLTVAVEQYTAEIRGASGE